MQVRSLNPDRPEWWPDQDDEPSTKSIMLPWTNWKEHSSLPSSFFSKVGLYLWPVIVCWNKSSTFPIQSFICSENSVIPIIVIAWFPSSASVSDADNVDFTYIWSLTKFDSFSFVLETQFIYSEAKEDVLLNRLVRREWPGRRSRCL